MAVYQCPDCLGVHEEATEPVVGLFVRCESCLLDVLLDDAASTNDVRLEPEPALQRPVAA